MKGFQCGTLIKKLDLRMYVTKKNDINGEGLCRDLKTIYSRYNLRYLRMLFILFLDTVH